MQQFVENNPRKKSQLINLFEITMKNSFERLIYLLQ